MVKIFLFEEVDKTSNRQGQLPHMSGNRAEQLFGNDKRRIYLNQFQAVPSR